MPRSCADLHQLRLGHLDRRAGRSTEIAPASGLQQSENQPEDRGLAGAARAEDDLHLARQQREADALAG